MTLSRWQEDWESFVLHLADRFTTGHSPEAVASELSERDVRWTGFIGVVRCAPGSTPLISMRMPRVQVRLGEACVFEGEHLGLTIEKTSDLEICKLAKEGDQLEFRAKIRKCGGRIRSFDFIRDDEQGKVCFLIRLSDVEIIHHSRS